jgi:L-fucose mutarotase/ribose pyranase (RbsD/FucU family)
MSSAATKLVSEWKIELSRCLPLYGHRNWIVVADSAYPAHSNPGIQTIKANEPHLEVLQEVLAVIERSGHVKTNVYTDRELAFVSEEDAPGVSSYREALPEMVGERRRTLPHEEIIAKLDQAAELFQVLVIKTDMKIPYTSVFLELDCAYWDDSAEQRLRSNLK